MAASPGDSIPDSDRRALQRLVSGATPQDELAPLIETIVSDLKADNIVKLLQASNAQMFIDVMDNVCATLFSARGSLLIILFIGAGQPRIHTANPQQMCEIVV